MQIVLSLQMLCALNYLFNDLIELYVSISKISKNEILQYN